MVGKQFDVVYDDFSGGHFVGAVGTHQPMNTFIGYNIGADPTDGSLCPLPDFFAATGSLGGIDTAATSTRVLSQYVGSGTNVLTWAGSTHAYNILYTQPLTPPLTVNTSAVGMPSAAKVGSSPIYFAPQNRVEILTANGNTLCHIDTALSIATTALPTSMKEIVAMGNFIFADTGSGKLYYSNPGDPTTWTSTDFILIPNTNGPNSITTNNLVLHQGNLYIATQFGWFVVTGIPNSTLSLRQATTIATGSFPVSIDTSIVSTGELSTKLSNQDQPPLGPLFRELVGNRDRGLNYGTGVGQRFPGPMLGMTRFGNYIVAVDQGGSSGVDEGGATFPAVNTFWILDARTGVWNRRQIAQPGATPTLGLSLQSQADLLVYRSSSSPENLQIAWLGQPGLLANQDDTYQVSTAQLAEHFGRVPFTVKDVICEVDYGHQPISAPLAAQERTISVYVKTTGVPIEAGQDLSLARSQSSTLTHTLPSLGQTGANYTTRRSWVRFNPTDGSDTYTASPVVTLTGCKLRRLILRCQEVA